MALDSVESIPNVAVDSRIVDSVRDQVMTPRRSLLGLPTGAGRWEERRRDAAKG
ncbi:MAG: hypothetical protein WD204_00295 [Acidimicrobiia bacterium]